MKTRYMTLNLTLAKARTIYELLNGGQVCARDRERILPEFLSLIYSSWGIKEVDALLKPARRRLPIWNAKKTIDKASGRP
jgi:hypothetical protein